jgi:enamine deaminase RidA (YjgF/YER057c/UK114 family)
MTDAPLWAASMPPAEVERQPAARLVDVLGGAMFGQDACGFAAFAAPVAAVRMPQLEPPGSQVEFWRAGGALTSGQCATVAWRHNDRLLFGSAVLDEAFAAEPDSGDPLATPLRVATRRIYDDVFAGLDHAGFPYLMRVWNFIPGINRETHGTERYRQFNVGRYESFAARGERAPEAAPAASAVGIGPGRLAVHFLASRVRPLLIENPRQVSAYRYPSRYGPRSPTFSRASLTRVDRQELLFVSGTASIVDHRSVHIGDVAAQTRECLANIAAVVERANLAASHTRYDLAALCYRIYVRQAADLATIRGEFERVVGARAPAQYLQADICRRELLVEIEASGGHGWESR